MPSTFFSPTNKFCGLLLTSDVDTITYLSYLSFTVSPINITFALDNGLETEVSNYVMFAFVNAFFFYKSVATSYYTATNDKVTYEYSHFLSYNHLMV